MRQKRRCGEPGMQFGNIGMTRSGLAQVIQSCAKGQASLGRVQVRSCSGPVSGRDHTETLLEGSHCGRQAREMWPAAVPDPCRVQETSRSPNSSKEVSGQKCRHGNIVGCQKGIPCSPRSACSFRRGESRHLCQVHAIHWWR